MNRIGMKRGKQIKIQTFEKNKYISGTVNICSFLNDTDGNATARLCVRVLLIDTWKWIVQSITVKHIRVKSVSLDVYRR